MTETEFIPAVLRLEPAFKERVWGGTQLRPGSKEPIGEAWLVHEDQPVQGGALAGLTLAEVTRRFPQEVLGQDRLAQRFPLLIKLLDCQDWLSVQVHPNDEQAARLVGAGELGKTEAWHVLDAQPGAKLISGTRSGVGQDELQEAILDGNVSSLTHEHAAQTGETLMVPAGTLHALGPGLLIYEVQQTSDTTYRVYDWDRPASAGRELHLKQSAEVTRPGQAQLTPAAPESVPGIRLLTQCQYFVLEELVGHGVEVLKGETGGRSPHLITVKSGEVTLKARGETMKLAGYDTVLLPASLGQYELQGNFQVLRSRLPD